MFDKKTSAPLIFQLPSSLEQEVETSDHIPSKHKKIQLPFTGTKVQCVTGTCGTFIHQQVEIGDHVYVEQYFEPLADIELRIYAPESMIILYGMFSGNLQLKYPDGRIFSQSKRRAMHYIPAGFSYTTALIAGQKYHAVYVIPSVSLLNELAKNYPQLVEPLTMLKHNSTLHHVLPYRKFNGDARKELNKMKSGSLSGQSSTVYYNNRISDFIISYLEDIHKENKSASSLTKQIESFISRVEEFPEKPVNVNAQALMIGLTPRALENAFKLRKGTTVIMYVQQKRLEKAKLLIARTNNSIAEISYEVGYTDHSYFSRIFKRATGQTPNEFRKKSNGHR
jgi:AraC-like DNA-binding protein